MAVTDKHVFGWNLEAKLRPVLEHVLHEELEKTAWRYDTFDWVGKQTKRQVELKARTTEYNRHQFGTWLVPACKLQGDVFYYWAEDRSLWRLVLEGKSLKDVYVNYPSFNPDQLHAWVPSHWFQRIPLLWRPRVKSQGLSCTSG